MTRIFQHLVSTSDRGPASEDDIAALETTVGPVPDDFKHFLRRTDGLSHFCSELDVELLDIENILDHGLLSFETFGSFFVIGCGIRRGYYVCLQEHEDQRYFYVDDFINATQSNEFEPRGDTFQCLLKNLVEQDAAEQEGRRPAYWRTVDETFESDEPALLVASRKLPEGLGVVRFWITEAEIAIVAHNCGMVSVEFCTANNHSTVDLSNKLPVKFGPNLVDGQLVLYQEAALHGEGKVFFVDVKTGNVNEVADVFDGVRIVEAPAPRIGTQWISARFTAQKSEISLLDTDGGSTEIVTSDPQLVPRQIAFSSDGRQLAMRCQRKEQGGREVVGLLQIIELPSGKILQELHTPHLGSFSSPLQFSNDGVRILAHQRNRVSGWDCKSGLQLFDLACPQLYSAAFIGDSGFLAVSQARGAYLVNYITGENLLTYPEETKTRYAFLPRDQSCFFTLDLYTAEIHKWDVPKRVLESCN